MYDPVDVEQTTDYCLKDFSPKTDKTLWILLTLRTATFIDQTANRRTNYGTKDYVFKCKQEK